jgi:hypothetical protein
VSSTAKPSSDTQNRRIERNKQVSSFSEITPSSSKIRYSSTAPTAQRKPLILANNTNLKQAQTVSPLIREKIPRRKKIDSGSGTDIDKKSKVPR